jgi:DNA-binding transcriptional regulator LsrR (DeoR family)
MAQQDIGDNSKLDDAARAGWLYYIAGNTQDEIAIKLGVSRQSAQRLVSLAVSARLIRFELDHPIGQCMRLGAELESRFGLKLVEVVPTDFAHPSALYGIGQTAARHLEMRLRSKEPAVIGVGTGRTLKAAVDHMTPMDCPQHKVVSMTANIALDGAAAYYNVIFNIADKTKARSYPWPLPVIADSVGEREVLLRQSIITSNLTLLASAQTIFVGVGSLDDNAPLVLDGFLSVDDLKKLQEAKAVGEICGWVFDANGVLIEGLTNERVTSAPIPSIDGRLMIAVAHGERKVAAIMAAITRPLVNGLITDEATARALLDR